MPRLGRLSPETATMQLTKVRLSLLKFLMTLSNDPINFWSPPALQLSFFYVFFSCCSFHNHRRLYLCLMTQLYWHCHSPTRTKVLLPFVSFDVNCICPLSMNRLLFQNLLQWLLYKRLLACTSRDVDLSKRKDCRILTDRNEGETCSYDGIKGVLVEEREVLIGVCQSDEHHIDLLDLNKRVDSISLYFLHIYYSYTFFCVKLIPRIPQYVSYKHCISSILVRKPVFLRIGPKI